MTASSHQPYLKELSKQLEQYLGAIEQQAYAQVGRNSI